MIFASKLAKIGKAERINCCQVEQNPLTFNVYLSDNFVTFKQLIFQNKKYTLTGALKKFGHIQMLGIDSKFAFARNDQTFAIIRVKNES